ncbi:MAG: SlyX family protein [Xanthomonadales bacterium]|nr:SlyX family protein [Xanthomonadales bacterium]
MPSPWEKRLDELESRLAFQDDTIENLNGVVSRQDREIRALQLQCAELAARFKELGDGSPASGGTGDFEVPPHY